MWVSKEFQAGAVSYPYDASLRAGSDHSAVIADLTLACRALLYGVTT